MAAFIEAVDLRKTYRVGKVEVPALRGISFTVERGTFVSVVGPSGSGKSTLFYLLGGLTRADSGRIVIDGDDFSRLSDAERTQMRKRKIGFVFQKFNLLPTLDARSNIEIARDIAGNGNFDPAYFARITDLLGLSTRLIHRPAELSGGEQQREFGQTVLMITHNPEAAAYGDQIIHMRDGQIVAPELDPQWTGSKG